MNKKIKLIKKNAIKLIIGIVIIILILLVGLKFFQKQNKLDDYKSEYSSVEFTNQNSFNVDIYNNDRKMINAKIKIRMSDSGNTGWYLDIPDLDGYKGEIVLYPNGKKDNFIYLHVGVNKIDVDYSNSYYVEWRNKENQHVDYFTVNDERLSMLKLTPKEYINKIEDKWNEIYQKLQNFDNSKLPSPWEENELFKKKYQDPAYRCNVNAEIKLAENDEAGAKKILEDCKDIFDAYNEQNTPEKISERMLKEDKLGTERWNIIQNNYISEIAGFGGIIDEMVSLYPQTLSDKDYEKIVLKYFYIQDILEAIADDNMVNTAVQLKIIDTYTGKTSHEKMVNALKTETNKLDKMIKDLIKKNK